MPTYVETYSIGKGIPSAEDLYNLKEDADTVIGVASIAFDEDGAGGFFSRVTAFAEIIDSDVLESVVVSTVSGNTVIKFIALDAFEDSDSIIGVAQINYLINGDMFPSTIEAGTSISALLSRDKEDALTVIGVGVPIAKEDFISPANSDSVIGRTEILYRDIYQARDIQSVIGIGIAITEREGGRVNFMASTEGSSEFLDNYILNSDTPDSATVIGVAINKATWDESFTLNGKAIISAQIAEGFTDNKTIIGKTVLYGEDDFPTRYDFIANPPFGQSGDGFVIGEGLALEESMPYVINAPEFSTVFSTFQYTISAVDLYNYSTSMDGVSEGSSTVDLSGVEVGFGLPAIAAGATASASGLFTAITRYYTTVTNVVGDGTYITYTANNSFVAGSQVTIYNDVDPPTSLWWEFVDAIIYSATSTQFVIANSATGSFTSGDAKAVVGSPYYNDPESQYS